MTTSVDSDLESQSLAGFDISPEFIEENKRLNLVKPERKSSLFTKVERAKRRKEVYRLHFELGIPAARVAEMMHIDKNVVKNDIRLLYRELGKERQMLDFRDYVAKQVTRLEAQRTRLMSYLEKVEDVNKKLIVERMIADIDFKLVTAIMKAEQTPDTFYDSVVEQMNRIAKEKKLDLRFTTLHEAYQISKKTRKNLDDLLERGL